MHRHMYWIPYLHLMTISSLGVKTMNNDFEMTERMSEIIRLDQKRYDKTAGDA